MNQHDYIEAGLKVMGLHALTNGECSCDNKKCRNGGKHPIVSNWQHTPHWSDEQLETMELMGQFKTGFGVLCSGLIVIDIDPRNGGTIESVQDYYDQAGFIVETGGGGWHIYFSAPTGTPLASHLPTHKGIDFKSSGFVVGCGSMHASGIGYKSFKGSPDSITEAPESLLKLLEKKNTHRAEHNGSIIDVTDTEISEMLAVLDPDSDYDEWIKIGMAIHHTTQGGGLNAWDGWSRNGKKYDGSTEKHWHSFGKSANPVTIGTLIHYAQKAGYQQPVVFDYDPPAIDDNSDEAIIAEMLSSAFDPLRPPGFCGEITEWINDNSINLRENLAVGATMHVVGSIAGCKYNDVDYGGTPNLYIACVADSGSGKEGIIKATKKLIASCGLSECVHTGVKSEQEIVRNLIDNNNSFYRIDEFGEHMAKMDSANAPSYLRGIKPQLLSAYSISGGSYELGGDLYRETEEKIKTNIAKLQKIVDNNEDKTGRYKEELDRKIQVLSNLPDGIQNFFISLIGFTAPNKFYEGINYDSVTNGFVGRCMFFIERNGNPKPRRHFYPKYQVPNGMQMKLLGINNGGGDVITEKKAYDAMQGVITYFWEKAENETKDSVAPIWRRGIELTIKISLILSVHGNLRTFENVAWAFNLIRGELESRVNIAISNIAGEDKERSGEALMRKILSKITADHGETAGVLKSKCGVKYSKQSVNDAIKILSEQGRIVGKMSTNSKGPKAKRWYLSS